MSLRLAFAGSLLLSGPAAWPDDASIELVRACYEAYNAHDIERMMSLVEDGVVWAEQAGEDTLTENADLEVIDDTVVRAKNLEGLAEALESYFDTFDRARSIVRDIQSSCCGEVTVFEEATWDFAGMPMSQCATAHYFIKANKITMVFYSNEQPCDYESPAS